MSTRARIGIEEPDGSVTSIYSHWDGYPDGAGAILLEHYSQPDELRQLLALGDVSSLGPELGERHDFDSHHSNEAASEWCLFYKRDRGEEDVNAISHDRDSWPDYGQEYEYLLTPKGWKVRSSYPHPSLGAGWVDLATVLARAEGSDHVSN